MNARTLVKLALIALVLLLLPAGTAFAATIHVGSTHGPNGADCSLAEAIRNANDAAQTHTDCIGGDSSGNIIILFADQNAEDSLSGYSTGLPAITRDLTINGGGRVIDGATAFTCFTITTAGVDLSLNGVILDRCRNAGHGGAISYIKTDTGGQTRSSLALNDVVVSNSLARGGSGSGGGIYVHSTSVDHPIYVGINRSAIHGNRADFNGGGLSLGAGTIVTINNSSIYGNTAAGRGGGIYATATLPGDARFSLNHLTITGNTANQPAGDTNKGGGIRVGGGTLTLRNSIIAGNTNAETNEDCRISGTDDVTIAAMSNNIIGSGATANCPTISVGGNPVTDPGLAASASSVTVGGIGIAMPFYDLLETSPAINAAGNCRSITRHDQRYYYRPYPANLGCDIGAIERGRARGRNEPGRGGNGGGSGDEASGGGGVIVSADGTVVRSGPSPAETCQNLAPAIAVSNAASGTACQLVSGASIGHPAVAAAMPASVVDVWGWVTPDTRVCFQASSGSIRFIDTAANPRTVANLAAYSQGDRVCAIINGPGQVALIADGSVPAAAQQQTGPIGSRTLSGCMVRLEYTLNFRESPGGPRLEFTDPWGERIPGWLPASVTLTALERTMDWFKVDYHGTQGWISAQYVEPRGTCA